MRWFFPMALLASAACTAAPSPLVPWHSGSIGTPSFGVLAGGVELPRSAVGLTWLRDDDRHFGTRELVGLVTRAAERVARDAPGAPLAVGDLSVEHGGRLLPHFSHRSGRDVDLLFYVTTLGGASVESPGFISVGADGLAWDRKGKRWLRLDVERQWLLVKALVEDEQALVQWIFVHRNVEAILVEWARARGEGTETLYRAMTVMHQPTPGGLHDDHLHVRVACTHDEIAQGCLPSGPERSWHPHAPVRDDLEELEAEIRTIAEQAP